MKIYVRTLVERDGERILMLEEIEASPVKDFDGVAIAHNPKHHQKGYCAYDINTGLYIFWARTKKDLTELLFNKKLQIEEARKTQLYQKRLKEFEEMKRL